METRTVDIGLWLKTTWGLYKQHFGLLVVVHLLVALLGSLTLGILMGPLWLGASMIVLALVDGKAPPPVGDVFKGFSKFLPSLLLLVLIGVSSALASLILQATCVLAPLAPVVVVGILTATMFSIFLIGERNLDVWPAVQQSFELSKPTFWPLFAWVLLLSLLSGLGAIACGIGVVLTMPLYTCGIAISYRHMVSGPPSVEPVSATPPAPPTASD